VKQSEELEKHLHTHTYLYVKGIISYVKVVFGVDYTVSGMHSWLKRQGQWIEGYEKLKHSLGENETIYFMDGVHTTHNIKLAYGWIKTGIRKEIAANSGRSRLNLSGAIDLI
jgi:hypothetical protein